MCKHMHSVPIPGHCQVRNQKIESVINVVKFNIVYQMLKKHLYKLAQYICLWHYKTTLTLFSH